jgi:hypothetical protein
MNRWRKTGKMFFIILLPSAHSKWKSEASSSSSSSRCSNNSAIPHFRYSINLIAYLHGRRRRCHSYSIVKLYLSLPSLAAEEWGFFPGWSEATHTHIMNSTRIDIFSSSLALAHFRWHDDAGELIESRIHFFVSCSMKNGRCWRCMRCLLMIFLIFFEFLILTHLILTDFLKFKLQCLTIDGATKLLQ